MSYFTRSALIFLALLFAAVVVTAFALHRIVFAFATGPVYWGWFTPNALPPILFFIALFAVAGFALTRFQNFQRPYAWAIALGAAFTALRFLGFWSIDPSGWVSYLWAAFEYCSPVAGALLGSKAAHRMRLSSGRSALAPN
jgi:hypothetical protein